MLKKNFIDNKRRLQFHRFEHKSMILKSINKSRSIRYPIRWFSNIKYEKSKKRASQVRIINRCVVSGRSRAVYRFVRMSRLFLRDSQFIGSIPGLVKAYW